MVNMLMYSGTDAQESRLAYASANRSQNGPTATIPAYCACDQKSVVSRWVEATLKEWQRHQKASAIISMLNGTAPARCRRCQPYTARAAEKTAGMIYRIVYGVARMQKPVPLCQPALCCWSCLCIIVGCFQNVYKQRLQIAGLLQARLPNISLNRCSMARLSSGATRRSRTAALGAPAVLARSWKA